MKITIKIYKGKPNRDQMQSIIAMIWDGFTSGIDTPNGINWEVFGDYDKLVGDQAK